MMDQSYLKSPPASSHFHFSSPQELLRPIDRFLSPSPSTGRGISTEPLPPINFRPHDKMSIAAATHPAPSSSLLSPPESPETTHVSIRQGREHNDRSEITMSDEPLLPIDGGISLDTPLFDVNDKNEPLIREVAARRSRRPPLQYRPSPEEYEVFVSSAWRLCKSDPLQWFRQEQRYNSMYRQATSRVTKSISTKSTSKRSAGGTPKSRPLTALSPSRQIHRPARQPRPTSKSLSLEAYGGHFLTPPRSDGSPAPRQRLTAPTREDSNFEALPDLTPPLASLPPGNSKVLQTDWRGTPLSIENEPHFDKLHPAEARLASVLRLTPAIYLSSKRRIFIEKVRRTQIGKEFRKTDSQKACKIDVNKASKLWTAFDKVGWFDFKYIEPHMNKEITIVP